MESIERFGNWIADEYRKNGMKWISRFGYTGIVVSPILAAYGAIKAYKAMEKRKKELGVEELPLKESAKIVAVNAAAPVATTVLTLVSTAKVQKELTKANESLSNQLASAVVLSRELKEAQKEVVGEEKAEEIQQKAAEKVVQNVDTKDVMCDPVRGIYPCIDTMTGQVFPTSQTRINAAMDMVRHNTFYGQNVSHTEFLEFCGGKQCFASDAYVWPASHNADYQIRIGSTLDSYGQLCYTIEYPYDCGLVYTEDLPF